mmetsp:Transcript_9744/g.14695  ORF Transcript_9744/g.14695 Transcript_9744/m.14695 type:complete len:408 (+) Transcript_9744:156-1379(+)
MEMDAAMDSQHGDSGDCSSDSSRNNSQLDQDWTIIDQEEEFESAVAGLTDMELGRSLLEIDCSRENEQVSTEQGTESEDAPLPLEDETPYEQTISSETLHSSGESAHLYPIDRDCAHNAEISSSGLSSLYSSFVSNSHSSVQNPYLDMLREQLQQELPELTHKIDEEKESYRTRCCALEKEIEVLRKERDEWRDRCMEKTLSQSPQNNAGIDITAVASSLSSLTHRLHNLTSEARFCRLLEEEGERPPILRPDVSDDSSTSPAQPSTPISVGLEQAMCGLVELENEFIPIISKLHSFLSLASGAAPTPKISLCCFQENDLALFFPTPRGDFLAFNVGAPHHYLSAESKALIGHDKHFRKIYVLGKIVLKEERVATKDNSPYHLAPGVKYYEISVTSVSQQLESGIRV